MLAGLVVNATVYIEGGMMNLVRKLTIKDLKDHKDECYAYCIDAGMDTIDSWNESCEMERRFARTFGEALNTKKERKDDNQI